MVLGSCENGETKTAVKGVDNEACVSVVGEGACVSYGVGRILQSNDGAGSDGWDRVESDIEEKTAPAFEQGCDVGCRCCQQILKCPGRRFWGSRDYGKGDDDSGRSGWDNIDS